MGSILSCDITKLRFFVSSLSLNFQSEGRQDRTERAERRLGGLGEEPKRASNKDRAVRRSTLLGGRSAVLGGRSILLDGRSTYSGACSNFRVLGVPPSRALP